MTTEILNKLWVAVLYPLMITDCIQASVMAGICYLASRINGYQTILRLLALMFAGRAFERVMFLVGNWHGFEVQPVYTTGYIYSAWLGMGARVLTLTPLVIYMIWFRPKRHSV